MRAPGSAAVLGVAAMMTLTTTTVRVEGEGEAVAFAAFVRATPDDTRSSGHGGAMAMSSGTSVALP